jgi:phosphoribosylaminoimidazolecarboxamide formyltransferase/IMP cyclohydrolase
MSLTAVKRALISVYDKTGVVDFAAGLVELGIEIISTGGTAELLSENKIPVTLVEDITGTPEMLDGRVKTLHPKIHAAILADRDNPEHMNQLEEQDIEAIDMVVVNLYEFVETAARPGCTFDEAIEMIDIGGPCLLRAAAKNHRHVFVVRDPRQYDFVLDTLRNDLDEQAWQRLRSANAFEVFMETSTYDDDIASWLSRDPQDGSPCVRTLRYLRTGMLRYGENPAQQAQLFQDYVPAAGADLITSCLEDATTAMSFNNYVDADAAQDLCRDLGDLARPAADPSLYVACFVKHTNPCGVGIAESPLAAYSQAYLGDPSAAMGGVLAQNRKIDADLAKAVMDSLSHWGKAAGVSAFFVEVWIAPEFDEAAIEVIRSRKPWGQRVRLLAVGDMSTLSSEDESDFKRIAGGGLFQDKDVLGLNEDDWEVVTRQPPTDRELADLRLAWLVCKHTKSNAITICKDNMLIGNGAGQMSRVMSCRLATWLAAENGHHKKLAGSVAASDAFFPFRDGPDLLIESGVRAIIQPGGSKRDDETVAACDENDVAMIFTGTRHFKH